MHPTGTVHRRVKTCTILSADEIRNQLSLSDRGLSTEETAHRRQQDGANVSAAQHADSVLHCVRRAFVNPFSTILFFLGLISFVTDVLLSDDYQKNAATVLLIFSMLLLSGVVRLIQELRAKRVADSLTRLIHTTVPVLRDGVWSELPAEDLVVGDQIRLEAGDRVPADVRLLTAADLFVAQSVITGESTILEKTAEALETVPSSLSDYRNTVFSGSTITGGRAVGVVLAVGPETVYGALSPTSPARKHGFDSGAESIAWVLIRFMAILVPIVFLASGLTKGNWLEAFLFALSVAVGLTPELLPMVVNACLARGSASMGRKQTIVKNLNAMQGFGSMDVLCVDKTGTLTGDTVLLEYYMDLLGNESQKVLDYAYLASRYHTGVGNHLDAAIRRVEAMPGRADYYQHLAQSHPKADEQPFDYGRRFASVLVQNGMEHLAILKGSIDQVAAQCSRVEIHGGIHPMGDHGLRDIHAVVDELLEDGMKVIAVAYKPVHGADLSAAQERDYILLGYLAFFDAPKQSAAGAIRTLLEQRVRVKVLTGDQLQVARSICRRLGLDTANCLTGAQLDALTDNELPTVLETATIFAELTPKQKAMVVENLQANGHTVGFLGDGINDLPAMLQADVGISVDNAAEAVQESADVILLKKDLGVLEEGILEGRKAFANLSKYIRITASSNFGNICAIVAAGVLLPFFPMTSIQLLLLNLLYDILCLSLPWDRVDPELLRRPLEWSGRSLGRFMTFFGPISSLFDLVTFAFLYFVLCPAVCGGSFLHLGPEGQLRFIALFQTGWFLESMWTQVLILQLLRTRQLPFLQSRPGRPVVLVTLLGIALFSLLPVSPLSGPLGLTPMPPAYFAFLIAVVLLYLLLVTLAKAQYLRKHHNLL